MIGSIITGVLGLANAAIGYDHASRNLDKQIAYQEYAQEMQNLANLQITREYNQAQKQLAQSQNEYNTEMWNKQNDYNSPKATMQRLVEAGINPRAYQQIGQFANAGAPTPAVTPEQKMREYTDPKLASTAQRMQKLELQNAYTEQRLRAINLGTDTLLAYRKQEEVKRHNIAVEAETQRHNLANEGYQSADFMLRDNAFRLAMAKEGIHYDVANRTFKLPDWLKDKPKEEYYVYLQEKRASIAKMKEERMYLYSQKIIKMNEAEWHKEVRLWDEVLKTIDTMMPKIQLKLK